MRWSPLCAMASLARAGRPAVWTTVGNYKVDVPLALTMGRQSRGPFEEEVRILDLQTSLPVAAVTISRTPAALKLLCSGAIEAFVSHPFAEIVAKISMESSGCGVDDLEVLWDSSVSVPPIVDFSVLTPCGGDEIIDWVGTQQQIVLPVPRALAYRHRMLHRGFGAALFNKDTREIFVHRRAASKKVFPSLHDMFIGGVAVHSESAMATLVREVEEEVGIDLRVPSGGTQSAGGGATVHSIGEITVFTDVSHAVVDCFLVELTPQQADSIVFKDGEIEWGEWMSVPHLRAMLEDNGDRSFVPTGVQAWRALPSLLRTSKECASYSALVEEMC